MATSAATERYQDGWRAGKPVEDPEKLKRWGYVGAKPSEYLVCTRRGQIDRSRSGQGMRIFKWPWLSVSQGRVVTNLVTHGLPKIAEALSQTFGTVHYTQFGGDANGGPLQAVPAALGQLLANAKSFGVVLPGPRVDDTPE